MGKLRDQMEMDMKLRRLSPRTITTYLGCMRNVTVYFGKSPAQLNEEEIRRYLHYLIDERKASQAVISQSYSALKFFFENTLQRQWNHKRVPRSKQHKKLPVVLSRQEVESILSVIENLKHRAILMTIYAAGLRISEATCLKVSDIDSERMTIRVSEGKGLKDRYTLLGERNAVLHTWGQTLIDHPHLHCIVTGGGLSLDGERWTACKGEFFLPLKALYKQEWVVYCKPPFRNAERVMEYLGRYTHRVAISNNRLVKLEGGRVTFRYRDRKDQDRVKRMTLDAEEFIRRFFLHILPDGFMKIRHYGILGNRNRKAKLALCRRLLGVQESQESREKEPWQDLLTRITGVDPRICPHCGKGKMVLKEMLNPSAPPLAP